MQSAVFIYFCSFGLPIRKSVIGYFNPVAAAAFLVSSPPKFENSAIGMYLGKYASPLCDCKLNTELYLSPTTYLQLSKALVSNKEHLQQLVRQTNIMHQSPRHIPLALSSNFISEIKKAITTTLSKYPKTDVEKPELPKVYEDSTMHEFINNES